MAYSRQYNRETSPSMSTKISWHLLSPKKSSSVHQEDSGRKNKKGETVQLIGVLHFVSQTTNTDTLPSNYQKVTMFIIGQAPTVKIQCWWFRCKGKTSLS